jgi:two-component system chemotaxis sensor kinase CheA
MDLNQYLDMFLAEAREHLQQLNLAVVRVEEDPKDRETVDEIFRIAHSFKGMSATMGFGAVAALTHKMEDVFELLRQRRGGLDRKAIDVLLECLDALEGAVEGIEQDGVEKLDADHLIERLSKLVRPRKVGQELVDPDAAAADAAPAAAPAPPALETVGVDGRRLLRVTVTLSDESLMPGVRAYQAITALGDHGEVLRSEPDAEALDGFSDRTVKVWVATDHPAEALEAAVLSVSDVATVESRDEEQDEKAATETAEPARRGARAATGSRGHGGGGTVRIDASRLDELMHLMGELVVHRTRVESLAAEAGVPELAQAMQDLTRSSQALQSMVMQVRMIPVEAVFLRFPRLVRDISSKLGKQVELNLAGQDTELDRTVVEALGDPIVHLVRNSLDHGLETPDERAAAGKPPTGTLEIAARHAGGNVVISVSDDGRGIDPQRIARKAAERGLLAPDAVDTVDAQRAVELLFEPGFSTADVTSDLSGRGVGMDAVRAAVRQLGGEVLMTSEHGKGTVSQIRLPLTLAIMSALLVEAGGLPFAVPLDRVERTLALDEYPIRSVAGQRMLVLRDGALPLVDAADALGYESLGDCTHGVVVRAAEHRVALAVDRLIGQRELVTRPLPAELGDGGALSGGAVLANGDIALIVDCDAVAVRDRRRAPRLAKAA